MTPLDALSFDNRYARLGRPFAEPVAPTPLPDPYWVSVNEEVAALLGIELDGAARAALLAWVTGNGAPVGAEPVAMLYAGHQFGHLVPQLGDGRAILLGQLRDPREPGRTWDLHLKGSGPTPFSRGFDGRAVLRSTIREYLCGEAMHHLGIPTTRGLCIAGSDAPVLREVPETAATLVRVAPSHVRFGSFEVFAVRREEAHLRRLADFVIEEHFPEAAALEGESRYVVFLEHVVHRTASLMAKWQAVGFTHGVMNTDNLSILGLTIDYGPYGFVEHYDPAYVPNHSDTGGRYALDQQPAIALWNLDRLAASLLPLTGRERAVAALDQYVPLFQRAYGAEMRAKLGLETRQDDDGPLLLDLLALLQAARADWTTFWRALGALPSGGELPAPLRALFPEPAARASFEQWATRYRARLAAEGSDDAARAERMRRANPKYVLRTWVAHQAVTLATEHRDYRELERILAVLRRPYDEQPEHEAYAAPPPEWAQHIVLSCSS